MKAIRNTLKTIEKLKEQSRPPPVNISQTVQLSLNFPVEEFVWMIRQMGDLIVDRLPQSVPIGVLPNFPQRPAGMISNSCSDFCCYGTSYPMVFSQNKFNNKSICAKIFIVLRPVLVFVSIVIFHTMNLMYIQIHVFVQRFLFLVSVRNGEHRLN